MPTLYVENVPEDMYEALRARAQSRRKSIAAEVIDILQQNVPTAVELSRRKQFVQLEAKIRAERPSVPGPFPSAEKMQTEDRDR